MSNPDIATYAGPVLVTCVYTLVYYATQINILLTRSRLTAEYSERGEKFDRYFGQDRQMLAADRIQLNTLEHMPTFLALLWLHAVFVGPYGATIAGGIYVTARATYPFIIGGQLGRSPKAAILVATVPGYGVIAYFAASLVWAVVSA